jgi:hypothetical protein
MREPRPTHVRFAHHPDPAVYVGLQRRPTPPTLLARTSLLIF